MDNKLKFRFFKTIYFINS